MTDKQADDDKPAIEPHPDYPGWFWWGEWRDPDSFAAQVGPMLFKPDGESRAVVRMFPEERHLNPGGSIHGGCVMSFIDMALFTGGFCAGIERAHYVTLDCQTRFIDRGRAGVPLDAHVRLLRQTPGGIAFLDGHVEQDGRICYSFSGCLKKVRDPRKRGDDASS